MRRFLALIALALPVAVAADAPPPLKALRGFEGGRWQQKPVGGGAASSSCVADPGLMVMGGKAAPSCSFTVLSDTEDSAAVTYRCPSGRSGRTEIRRDTQGIFTVAAQGLDGGLPFASRVEWRRTGAC